MNKSIIASLCVGLAGCAFDAVEHASHVEAGGLLGVTLRLSGGGTVSGAAAVCAGLPAGWSVEGASYTGSASGADDLSGTALEDPQAAIQFGVRPDIVWSCWTHAGAEDWGDASAGVVSMDIRVPLDASGPQALLWSLGTTGLTGELLSATATSTVYVDSPGHPLDAASQTASWTEGGAVIGTPTGFLSVGELGLSSSTDGVSWSVTGEGLVGLTGASYGGDTLWAWTDDALSCWTPLDAWQLVDVAWSTSNVHAVALDSGLLVVDDETATLEQVDQVGVYDRVVPSGAEPEGLAASGTHAVWRLWNATLRQPELGFSSDSGVSWTTVPAPAIPQAVGQHDRVGVSADGGFLWANVASTSTGAHVSLWRGRAAGGWQALGVWPVGELAPTTTPVACGERWLVGLPWGAWLAVDGNGTVSRHALGRSADAIEYLCSGDVMTVVQSGRVTGGAAWVDAPDLSALALPVGVVGDAYSAPVGQSEWTTTMDGLPSGLSLVAGQLSGIPDQAGEFDVRVQATDEWSRTDVVQLSLLVEQADVDDLDTDDADTEPGTDSILEDEGTFDIDPGDADDTASLDIQPTGGCSTVPAPLFLSWPALFLIFGCRRRR